MRHVHVVSIHIPYPPDYGGAIDEFYRLKALKELGIEITLHCFLYGTRQRAPELERFCNKVYYYKRAMTLWNAIGRRPFIVRSREDPELLINLEGNVWKRFVLVPNYFLKVKRKVRWDTQ